MAEPNDPSTNITFGQNNPDTLGWVYGPNTRGTIDIVWGCVVVLITAIWTVIHVNIPAKGESEWKTILRRFRWGCVSIFAPDFLTLVAASQWDAAHKSVAQMRELLEVRDENERWCMEHAFYANSGGFLLQCPDTLAFPINAASMHYLVSKGYIELPRITKDEVWDKSKADVFAKGAAILQGTWMIIGSIARLIQHLPLSPLELFTLAFVVSTAMSYFFWWRKPQNVSTATVLVCKYSVARIRADAGLTPEGYDRTPLDFVEVPLQHWKRRSMWTTFDLETGSKSRDQKSLTPSVTELVPTSSSAETADFKSVSRKNSEASLVGPFSPGPRPLQPVSESDEEDRSFTLGKRKDSEITLIGQRLNDLASPTSPSPAKLSPVKEKGLDMIDRVNSDLTTIETNQYTQQPVNRIPDDAVLPSRLPSKILLSLMLPSMIHSTIHLLGWNIDYPSNIEKQLWRASAVTLTAMSCIAVGAVRALAIANYKGQYNLVWFWVNTNRVVKERPPKKERPSGKLTPGQRLARAGQSMALGEVLRDFSIWDCSLALATLGLVLARCYIIIEVIISLRALPSATFLTVNWLSFIPHV